MALDVFIELEMVELNEAKIYKVINFAKHQNIKVKKKEIYINKETTAEKIEVPINENSQIEKNEDKKLDNKTIGNAVKNTVAANIENLENTNNKDMVTV